jgi:hypothetical protein
MAVTVGVISIGTGAIGTQYSITGLAFRPAFIRFRWPGAGAADAGPTQADLFPGIGFAMENGKRGCISYYLQNASDPYTCGSGLWNTAAIVRQIGASTTAGKLDWSSMNDDGATFVVDEVFNSAIFAFYEAYSGAEFNVIEVTEPGSAGVVAYTGAGFRPTYVEILGTGRTAFDAPDADLAWCFGAATGSAAANNAVLARYEETGLGSANTSVYCRSTECLAIIGGASVQCRASLSTFDSDGLSLNWLERSSTRKFLLIVATGRWQVENVSMPTNTNAFTETGMTWTPEGLMLVGAGLDEATQDTVDPLPGNEGGGESIGFVTGPTERVVCCTRGSTDGSTGVSKMSYYNQTDEIYANLNYNVGVTIEALGDLNSAFSPDTIELIMDDAEATATFAWYSAYGPPIIAFRARLVRYQHNTYQSRDAGRTLIRDVLGRTVPNHDVKPDNFIFAGGPAFITPTKFSSLIVNPDTYYIESVQPTEDRVKTETNRESLIQSLFRRLGS